ncbi:MAG: hypothetical protein IIC81_02020 [Chloroflexi bacterium]|nr:hypothetical protein [Chloroflexota bacterium]
MKLMRRAKFVFAGGLAAIALIALACGSSSEPTPTPVPSPTATSTPLPAPTGVPTSPDETELTQTQVFKGFGFSIDYPEGWTATTEGKFTDIIEFQEDSELSSISGAPERKGYGVSLQRVTLDFLRNTGLPDQPSLEDLLNLNSRLFGWEVLETSNTSVFGVPALSVTIRSPSNAGITLIGFVKDEAFALSMIAPTEEARDQFRPTWIRMLESIKPVTEAAASVEEIYFEEVDEATMLTGAKFGKFGAIFREAFPTRQRLIDALLEAGVGTAFTATVEALHGIEPPEQLETEHNALVEHFRELLRLDRQAEQYIRDGDVAGFVLTNGLLGEVSATFTISLPADFCNSLNPGGSPLCSPLEPLPGGTYGSQLNDIFRTFQSQFSGLAGSLAFPLVLTPEESALVINDLAPKAATLFSETQAQVRALTPPAEFSAAHDLLIPYFDQLIDLFNEAVEAGVAGETGITRRTLDDITRVGCEVRESFSPVEFNDLVDVHFDRCGPPPS